MNQDTVKGGAQKLVGKLKETAGEITHNNQLRAEGKIDQMKGGAREAIGHAKDAASNAASYLRSKT